MRPPIATVFLVVLILSTYFILSNGNPYMEEQQLRNTALKATSFPLSLVTQLFTHVGLLHLLGNLLPLLAFGVIVENRLRSYDVIVIFLCAGTIAGCVFALLSPQTMLAGASSGITGLIGRRYSFTPRRQPPL